MPFAIHSLILRTLKPNYPKIFTPEIKKKLRKLINTCSKLSVLALDMIYESNGRRNAPNARANLLEETSFQWHESCTSINVVFWQGILLVFYRTNALERFAITHFAGENPRITPTTKERSNHYASLTQNALRT